MKQLAVLLYRLGLKKSHVIFFQNSANLNFCLKQGIVKGKPVLLPGSGVNLRYHTLQEYPDKSDDVIKILFIGRLKRSKGVEELFKSAAEIKAKYGDKVEFQVLGKEVEGCHTRLDEAVNMGLVTYLGSTTDVRPFLKRVHCTIMPSYYEGMSNVNLESSANGRPVITTDIPGCREIVDDGNTGFLAKHQDSKSLTEAIERFVVLTYEQKREMGLLARQKVEQEFDRQIVIDAYLKEIR